MSFEPRIIEPDDPLDELALPADLAQLAEQLQADARHIAECHSAGAAAAALVKRKTSRRWWLAAASVLMAASAWSLAQFAPWARQAPVLHGLGRQLVRAGHERPAVRSDSVQRADVAIPAAFFQELTGPEQEGLLDLLEDTSVEQASLSI